MSSMLEQAIIDAEALREAALKNAESAIIDKYSDELKEVVNGLLEEQVDPEMMGMPGEDPMMAAPELGGAPVGGNPLDQSMETQVPLAATGGDKLCPCPDDEQVVVIDLDQLMASQETDDPGLMSDMPGPSHEESAIAMMMEQKEENLDISELALKEIVEENEEVSLNEEELEELASAVSEALKVDLPRKDTGYGPAGTPRGIEELNDQVALANEQDDEVSEEMEAVRSAASELQKENTQLKETLNRLAEHLENSNLMNAKLLYTNQILVSASLNERQKTKIAEAISKSESPEEAKTIFETLQSTVGVAGGKSQPKSLSEVVNRPSSTMMPRKHERKASNNAPTLDRWKILAGIKH